MNIITVSPIDVTLCMNSAEQSLDTTAFVDGWTAAVEMVNAVDIWVLAANEIGFKIP